MKTVALCVLLAILGVANARRDDCPDFCAEVYTPVCAISDENEKRVFGNECKMLQSNCQNNTRFNILKFSADCNQSGVSGIRERIPGLIPGLPTCPDQWKPVCGSDGNDTKTFPNECIMSILNYLNKNKYQTINYGPCKDSDMPKSMQKPRRGCGVCIQVYKPVCGSDGYEIRTFSNQCMLENFNCNQYRSFVRTRSGACF